MTLFWHKIIDTKAVLKASVIPDSKTELETFQSYFHTEWICPFIPT